MRVFVFLVDSCCLVVVCVAFLFFVVVKRVVMVSFSLLANVCLWFLCLFLWFQICLLLNNVFVIVVFSLFSCFGWFVLVFLWSI